ncbi:helix-turn-helix transcriptional regulator [Anaerobutyricum hallii]|uniref:helix-turn-helix domain-containing protein n=1 Tax=Anaerobutyricum hallii TaxID=39488 RepID=UPI001ADD85E5|nr:helix-turn-helix transcriptional regulator [Anaerobutyricum hallii]MBP0066099.1 helix-turn-helix transcriptional regulator [Anaerobutyricum hallii]
MTQGERIKEVRKTLGLTLDKFGEKLGVKKAALSAIENGKRNLTEQMTISICREYKVNYDYLTYGDGEMFEDLPETILDELCIEYDLDDDDRDILNFYLGLPADARDAIKKQIKKIFVKE